MQHVRPKPRLQFCHPGLLVIAGRHQIGDFPSERHTIVTCGASCTAFHCLFSATNFWPEAASASRDRGSDRETSSRRHVCPVAPPLRQPVCSGARWPYLNVYDHSSNAPTPPCGVGRSGNVRARRADLPSTPPLNMLMTATRVGNPKNLQLWSTGRPADQSTASPAAPRNPCASSTACPSGERTKSTNPSARSGRPERTSGAIG